MFSREAALIDIDRSLEFEVAAAYTGLTQFSFLAYL